MSHADAAGAASPEVPPDGSPADGPSASAAPSPARRQRVSATLDNPFGWGFLATLGGLVAIGLAGALASLATVLIAIGVALFIAMALEPVVRVVERRGLSRGAAIAVVSVVFLLLVSSLLAIVVPTAVTQVGVFAASFPDYVADIQNSGWFRGLVERTGEQNSYARTLERAGTWLADPANLLALGGGALAVGSGVVNGIAGTLIALALSLYFLASMRSIKRSFTRLAPAHSRTDIAKIINELTEAVGGYVSGMAVLAVCNATFTFILLSILGVPFAPLLAALALLMTMIPMVGPLLFWGIASIMSLLSIGSLGWAFAGAYFGYMQIEAYVLTPRIMMRAVSIPAPLVLIGALVGGTLLGLLGALVAVPVTATVLMVVQEVIMPRQDAKLVADDAHPAPE